MTKQTDNKNLLSYKKHNLIAILDGLDLFLNFSIITHLCIFFFSEIDGRVSIIISSSLLLISFFSWLFSNILQGLNKNARVTIAEFV